MFFKKNINTNFQKGFTVVEALIIVGVTAVLFVSTAVLIRGQIAEQDNRDNLFKAQQETRDIVKTVENGDISESTAWTGGVAGEACTKNSDSQGMDVSGVSNNCSIIGTVLWFDSQENLIKYKYVGYNSTNGQYYNASNNNWNVVDVPGSLVITPVDASNDKVVFIGYAEASKNLGNINDSITPQSIQIYIGDPTVQGAPILLPDAGMKVCFQGSQRSALIIGKNKSKDVELVMQDDGSNCNENYVSYYGEGGEWSVSEVEEESEGGWWFFTN
jgi:hypothetical protein